MIGYHLHISHYPPSIDTSKMLLPRHYIIESMSTEEKLTPRSRLPTEFEDSMSAQPAKVEFNTTDAVAFIDCKPQSYKALSQLFSVKEQRPRGCYRNLPNCLCLAPPQYKTL